MTREKLERYLGKKVEIRLFDNEVVSGVLRKTGEDAFKNNANLYLPRNEYFVTRIENSVMYTSCLFKVSHIKGLKEED